MADLDYKKENMKELHAPDKKVKAGVYVIAALLVLVYLLPIYVMLNQSFRFQPLGFVMKYFGVGSGMIPKF